MIERVSWSKKIQKPSQQGKVEVSVATRESQSSSLKEESID